MRKDKIDNIVFAVGLLKGENDSDIEVMLTKLKLDIHIIFDIILILLLRFINIRLD